MTDAANPKQQVWVLVNNYDELYGNCFFTNDKDAQAFLEKLQQDNDDLWGYSPVLLLPHIPYRY